MIFCQFIAFIILINCAKFHIPTIDRNKVITLNVFHLFLCTFSSHVREVGVCASPLPEVVCTCILTKSLLHRGRLIDNHNYKLVTIIDYINCNKWKRLKYQSFLWPRCVATSGNYVYVSWSFIEELWIIRKLFTFMLGITFLFV